jgi:hypothetical protein
VYGKAKIRELALSTKLTLDTDKFVASASLIKIHPDTPLETGKITIQKGDLTIQQGDLDFTTTPPRTTSARVKFDSDFVLTDGGANVLKASNAANGRLVNVYNFNVNAFGSGSEDGGGKLTVTDVSSNVVFSVNNQGNVDVTGDIKLREGLVVDNDSNSPVFEVAKNSGNTRVWGTFQADGASAMKASVTLGSTASDSVLVKAELVADENSRFDADVTVTGKSVLGGATLGGDLSFPNSKRFNVVDNTFGSLQIGSEKTCKITAVSTAPQATVTCKNHGFRDGELITIQNVKGMTELNEREFVVDQRAADTFKIVLVDGSAVNSSQFSGYTSGGDAVKALLRMDSRNGHDATTMSSSLRVMSTLSLHGEVEFTGQPDELVTFANTRSVVIKSQEAESLRFVTSSGIGSPTPGISRANPGYVRTLAAHPFGGNAKIMFANVKGMLEINGKALEVGENPSTHGFRLQGGYSNTEGHLYTSGLDGNEGVAREYSVSRGIGESDDEKTFDRAGGSSGTGAYQHKLKLLGAWSNWMVKGHKYLIRGFQMCSSLHGPFVYGRQGAPTLDGVDLDFTNVRAECEVGDDDKDDTGTLIRMDYLSSSPINITQITKSYPEITLHSEDDHGLAAGDVLFSWNITGLDGEPVIVATVPSSKQFTLAGIDGSELEMKVAAGAYKVGEHITQNSGPISGYVMEVFRYIELTLHADDRAHGKLPFTGEEVEQYGSNSAGTIVFETLPPFGFEPSAACSTPSIDCRLQEPQRRPTPQCRQSYWPTPPFESAT